jgi:hypothetical protein
LHVLSHTATFGAVRFSPLPPNRERRERLARFTLGA